MFWYFDVLVWFGLSMFWSVDVLVCRRFGLSTLWSVDVLVCRRLVVDVSVCRRFDQLPTKGSTLTHQILFINMVIILQTTYQNGFLQWHFSKSRSPWVLLLKYNLHFTLHRLYIVNIFPTFKHFNPSFSPLMPRIKYRTCPQWSPATFIWGQAIIPHASKPYLSTYLTFWHHMSQRALDLYILTCLDISSVHTMMTQRSRSLAKIFISFCNLTSVHHQQCCQDPSLSFSLRDSQFLWILTGHLSKFRTTENL